MGKVYTWVALGAAAALVTGGCTGADVEHDGAVELGRIDAPLPAAGGNGLIQINEIGNDYANKAAGLGAALELSTSNGITMVSGERQLNPLASKGGSTTPGGLSVNCYNKDFSACTGVADGVMSNQTGLLNCSGNGSLQTATYLVKCALNSSQFLRLRQCNGSTALFQGHFGVATQWLNGRCDVDCQEKVSACLMALTNGTGNSVEVTLGSADMPLGIGLDPNYPREEYAFWGNLFLNAADTNYCRGVDRLAARNCRNDTGQYPSGHSACRYYYRGPCEDVCGIRGNNVWRNCGGSAGDNVITVHRQ